MAVYVVTGVVPTSWTNNTNLVGTAVAHREATLSIDCAATDSTAFTASLKARTFVTGLRSATASMRGRWNPSYMCTGIGLTFANGYVANLRKFDVALKWEEHDVTVGTGSAITSRLYVPGLLTASGTYEAFIDDTTDLLQPGGTTTGAATFKLIENGTTDHTLSGDIVVEQLGATFVVGGVPVARYSYKFTGDVTGAGSGGTYANSPFTVGSAAQPIPTAGTLTLTGTGSQTYAGSAFPVGITVSAEVGQELGVSVDARFSGDITIG